MGGGDWSYCGGGGRGNWYDLKDTTPIKLFNIQLIGGRHGWSTVTIGGGVL
jgi:hypothetical protein